LFVIGVMSIDPKLDISNLEINFEGTDAGTDECQVCYKIYNKLEGTDSYWRFEWTEFTELDQNGNECCEIGSNCTFGVGCNRHQITQLPNDFPTTLNGTTGVSFAKAVYSGPPANCTPPGDPDFICPNFGFNYQIYTDKTTIPIGSNQTYTVQANSLKSTFHVDTWKFASTSIGLRIKITIYAINLNPTYYLQPSNTDPSNPQFGGFNAVTVQSSQASIEVSFSEYGLIDGSSTPIPLNISGPYPQSFDQYARVFYIDAPKFHTSFDWDPNVYLVSQVSSSNLKSNSILLILFLIGIQVVSLV